MPSIAEVEGRHKPNYWQTVLMVNVMIIYSGLKCCHLYCSTWLQNAFEWPCSALLSTWVLCGQPQSFPDESDGPTQAERFCKMERKRERETESHGSTEGEKNRTETWLEWKTADWTYGLGKFEVLFSEPSTAVNLQCLCELLLKPNPWLGQGRSFQSCREEFFHWQTACSFSKGENDRQEKIKESVHVCTSTCPCIRFIVLLLESNVV